MLRINDLSKESKVFNITTDGGVAQAQRKYLGGAKDKVPPMRFLKTSVDRECAGIVVTCLCFPISYINPIQAVLCCCILSVGERTIPRIYRLLFKVRKQILNVRKECEVTSISSREPNTIISSLLEQIDIVPSPRYLFYSSATREVEQVRQYIKCIDDLVKDVESVRELDEREIVWLEWVREICLPAKDFLTSFVSKREQEIKRSAKLKAPTFIGADSELRKKMKVIRSRIQHAYRRRWIYGMVESDEIKELQPSKAFELESIWRDLRLMSALVKDVQGMKDKGERVKVWLEQMGDLALEIDALNTQIQGHQEKMKGGLGGELRVLSSIAEKTEKISSKFHATSERKSTYDIGTFEGKRGKISSSDIIVEDDDNNLEEAETGSSQQHTKTGRYVREIEVTESSLTKASIDMGPSTSETVEKPHATASTEIPPTSSLQKDKKET